MIAVISDSHIPHRAEEIPEPFIEICREADVLVHCGDFETEEMYEKLDEVSDEFHAVRGNCDRFEVDLYDSFELEGVSFGIYHGSKIHPRGHEPALSRTAEQMDVDVLFNGHTHQQDASIHEGKLLLNPGSCTGVAGGSYSGGEPRMMKVGLEDEIKVEMLELRDGEPETLEENRYDPQQFKNGS